MHIMPICMLSPNLILKDPTYIFAIMWPVSIRVQLIANQIQKRSNILSTVYDRPIEPLRPSTNPLHSASSTFGQDEKMLWQDALLVLRSQNTFGMKSRSSFTSETMIRGASCAIFGRSTEIWEMDDEVLEAATDC